MTRTQLKSGVRAGAVTLNHSEKLVRLKSGVRAGAMTLNHSEKLVSQPR